MWKYFAKFGLKGEVMKKIVFTALILFFPFLLLTGSPAQEAKIIGDVNGDGIVNILDLVLVASQIGKSIDPTQVPNPDVNEDGTVDILD